MNKLIGYEIRGFEDSCRHLTAVYTKCLKTVFNGSNLYRFKNYIFYQTVDGRWCLSTGERAMMKGHCLLRSQPVCENPAAPTVRWEMNVAPGVGATGSDKINAKSKDATKHKDGWIPCPSLTVSDVTFRYVHHWRSSFIAKHSAPLHVQGMGPTLAGFNGFYKPMAKHRFPDPEHKEWTIYQKTTASALAAAASATAASNVSGSRSPTHSKVAAAVTAAEGRKTAFLFRNSTTARWAFANNFEDVQAGTNVVVSSTEPLMHPADTGVTWRLRENMDWTYRLVGVAVTVVPARTLNHLLDLGNLDAHQPIKINFRHADGELETFFGTDHSVEELTNVHYVSATPRFIFRNSFNKFMMANNKADVEADRGIYRRYVAEISTMFKAHNIGVCPLDQCPGSARVTWSWWYTLVADCVTVFFLLLADFFFLCICFTPAARTVTRCPSICTDGRLGTAKPGNTTEMCFARWVFRTSVTSCSIPNCT